MTSYLSSKTLPSRTNTREPVLSYDDRILYKENIKQFLVMFTKYPEGFRHSCRGCYLYNVKNGLNLPKSTKNKPKEITFLRHLYQECPNQSFITNIVSKQKLHLFLKNANAFQNNK